MQALKLKCKEDFKLWFSPTGLDKRSQKQMRDWTGIRHQVAAETPERCPYSVASITVCFFFQASKLEPPSLSAGLGGARIHPDFAEACSSLIGVNHHDSRPTRQLHDCGWTGAGSTAATPRRTTVQGAGTRGQRPVIRCYSNDGMHASQNPRVQVGIASLDDPVWVCSAARGATNREPEDPTAPSSGFCVYLA